MLSRLYYHKGNENHPNFKKTCTSRALYQGVIHKNYDRVTFLRPRSPIFVNGVLWSEKKAGVTVREEAIVTGKGVVVDAAPLGDLCR